MPTDKVAGEVDDYRPRLPHEVTLRRVVNGYEIDVYEPAGEIRASFVFLLESEALEAANMIFTKGRWAFQASLSTPPYNAGVKR